MDEHKLIRSESGLELLAKVREISMKLPEVTEAVDKFGHTSFRVKDKPFVMMGENEEGATLSLKVLPTTQDVLLQQPERFFKTHYIGHHGWVSLQSTKDLDWQEIQELITEGYLRSAPKSLQKKLME